MAEAPLPPGSTIGMLGGGQLGRMFVHAAQRLGLRVLVLDPDTDSPAGRAADRLLCESAAALALYGRRLPGADADTRLLLLAPAASLQALSRQYAALYGLPETLRAAVQFRLEQQFATPWRRFELAELPAGTHPALLIHDRSDRALAVGHTLHIGQHWPQARILLTEGLGHQRLLQAAPVIAAALAYLRGEKIGTPATPASVSGCY